MSAAGSGRGIGGVGAAVKVEQALVSRARQAAMASGFIGSYLRGQGVSGNPPRIAGFRLFFGFLNGDCGFSLRLETACCNSGVDTGKLVSSIRIALMLAAVVVAQSEQKDGRHNGAQKS